MKRRKAAKDWKVGDRVEAPAEQPNERPPAERLARADGKQTKAERLASLPPEKRKLAVDAKGRFEEAAARMVRREAATAMEFDDGAAKSGETRKARRGKKKSSRASARALIESGDVRAPVLVKRCEQVGEANALSPLAESRLGRTRLLRMIEEGQYRAGIQFEAVVQIYRMMHGYGLGQPQAIDILRLGGVSLSHREFSRQEIEAVNARYGKAFRALHDTGRGVHMVTVGVIFHDEPVTDVTLHALRIGLNALSSHFNRGKGNRILAWNPGGKLRIDPALWEHPGIAMQAQQEAERAKPDGEAEKPDSAGGDGA